MGIRETRPVELKAEIKPGRFFIVGGQKAYVAEMGKEFTQQYGDKDARLRVIFDNGTENNMLRRSLQRALHKDAAGRRITDATAGPLFAGQTEDGDEVSGTIYVLRSKSNLPFVAENRDLVHKIGVTNASVEERIAGARLEPTFLNGGCRGRRHLQALQHQPQQAGKRDSPHLCPRVVTLQRPGHRSHRRARQRGRRSGPRV